VLWSFGASTVAADGKTVTINSPETKQALEFAVELYNKTMTNEVLSWDDSANNQGLAAGRISWIHNPISALRTIEKQDMALADKIWIAKPPAGPKGRISSGTTNSWTAMAWTKNAPAAKAFFQDYYAIFPEAYKASEAYNNPFLKKYLQKPMPILSESPKYAIVQDAHEIFQATGYPGQPTPAAGEVEGNWIVPLMVAKAVTENNVPGAIEWAEQKIKAIYDKNR
jgi:multiple sugar transport system substrate-binding protein